MRLERTKNAKRNIAFGLVNQIITIVMPFIIRTVTIKTIGTEYLGLSNLFTSILTVLSISELGVGSAIVFCMYKPIAEDDDATLCALLNLYKKIYRIIGLFILGVGIIIIPFLPSLIKGGYPEEINITLLYIIYLFNTSISYFLFAYYSSLLSAFQRTDILSNVNSLLAIIRYTVQIIILVVWRNYYLYVLILPLVTVISNLANYYFAKKLFPQFVCTGKVSDSLLHDIKVKVLGMVIGKVQAISRNSFDSIFIAAFLGLVDTAIYSNYYYIMSSIVMILYVFIQSITAGVGNTVANESVEKNYADMNKINFIFMWVSGWCSICLLCLYQPFMKIWMGEDMMFDFPVVILFSIYFYALKIGDIRSIYFEANGLWWENRYKAIFESISNITLNYILGKHFGVYGILLATIITILVINFGYGSRIVFRHYFGMSRIQAYYLKNLKYFTVTCFVGSIVYLLCRTVMFKGFVGFIIAGIICAIVPNILFVIIYWRDNDFKISIPWILRAFSLNRIGIIHAIITKVEEANDK